MPIKPTAVPVLFLALAMTSPVTAQDGGVSTGGGEIRDGSAFGRDATTPSRIASSRIEMNRGRHTGQPQSLTTADVRRQAETAVDRAGFVCTVLEASPIGRTRSGRPLIEIDCAEGAGMVVADDEPVTAVDCLDLAPDAGQGGRNRRVVTQCTLPANLAAIAAEPQSARN